MSYCANCGHEVKGSPKFCSQCGKLYHSYEEIRDVWDGFMTVVIAAVEVMKKEGTEIPDQKFFHFYTLQLILASSESVEIARERMAKAIAKFGNTKYSGMAQFLRYLAVMGLSNWQQYREKEFSGGLTRVKSSLTDEFVRSIGVKDKDNPYELEHKVLGFLEYAVTKEPDNPLTSEIIDLLLSPMNKDQ